MEVTNKELGISSKDIAKCSDRIQLKKWLSQLEGHMVNIGGQISEAKAKAANGECVDPDWRHRVKQYKKVQGVLKFQIGTRLAELKSQNHRELMEVERNFWKEKVEEIAPEYMELFYSELKELRKKTAI